MMLYGVSPIIQDALVTELCFDKCGKILVAGADGGEGLGPVFLCNQKICQYEDKTSPILGKIQGEDFKVRKLKGGK